MRSGERSQAKRTSASDGANVLTFPRQRRSCQHALVRKPGWRRWGTQQNPEGTDAFRRAVRRNCKRVGTRDKDVASCAGRAVGGNGVVVAVVEVIRVARQVVRGTVYAQDRSLRAAPNSRGVESVALGLVRARMRRGFVRAEGSRIGGDVGGVGVRGVLCVQRTPRRDRNRRAAGGSCRMRR